MSRKTEKDYGPSVRASDVESAEAGARVAVTGAIFDRELLDSMVVDGWLRSQRHPEADLWIYNYTEKTQYENHWTPETLVCRGLILGPSGEVIARPFAKFFNYGDAQNTPEQLPAEPFVVTEKIDGSLGILYYVDGERFIATRGSFTSDQAKVGTAMLWEHDLTHEPDETPLFEIIYPENRIVVDYGDRRELVLLDCVDHATGASRPLPSYTGRTVQHYGSHPIEKLRDVTKQTNREGFVVSFESGYRVKVKFAEYVRLHKIVTGVNSRMIWEALRDGQDLPDLTDVPDEIFVWIDKTRDELLDAYASVEADALRVYENAPRTTNRKALAGHFIDSGANASVLFRMLDGKPYSDLIWKAIKPEPMTPTGPPLNTATREADADLTATGTRGAQPNKPNPTAPKGNQP